MVAGNQVQYFLMTGLNHGTTGALVAVLIPVPLIAVPVAFLSHFVLDTIPHFGWSYDKDVFARNRSKIFRIGFGAEVPLSLAAIIGWPIFMRPAVSWYVTLLCIAAAMFMDLVWVYRGIGEVITRYEKPKNWINQFHLDISHHHQNVPIGISWELIYFGAASSLIIWLVH